MRPYRPKNRKTTQFSLFVLYNWRKEEKQNVLIFVVRSFRMIVPFVLYTLRLNETSHGGGEMTVKTGHLNLGSPCDHEALKTK
jgi:hypothetical protein